MGRQSDVSHHPLLFQFHKKAKGASLLICLPVFFFIQTVDKSIVCPCQVRNKKFFDNFILTHAFNIKNFLHKGEFLIYHKLQKKPINVSSLDQKKLLADQQMSLLQKSHLQVAKMAQEPLQLPHWLHTPSLHFQ